MRPLLDPRSGDFEDDASSTKKRSLLSIAGSLLAEISLPKLAAAWMLLIGFPGLLLGAAPILVSIWLASVSAHAANAFYEIWPALLLLPLAAIGWFGGRRLLRLAQDNFWSLNALAVQPAYIAFREGFRHAAEALLKPGDTDAQLASFRARTAAVAGVAVFVLGVCVAVAVWPASRWIVSPADLVSAQRWLPLLLANGVVLVSGYFAAAALVWGLADAMAPQPHDLRTFRAASGGRIWRVAHLSDIHTVAEQYGFRIESGRAGPQGNARLRLTLARLSAIHAAQPLDWILITGDLTDAGRSAEWAEFFDMLEPYPELAGRMIAVPGNHDVNVVDRASPARLELPMSPTKRLRQLRALSALDLLHGSRVHVVERATGRMGPTLRDTLAPHAKEIAAFGDTGSTRLSRSLAPLWEAAFPLVLPPNEPGGLGVIMLNSNAETHFSFTNALGLISAAQVGVLESAFAQYPGACWIVALHHHVIEYPQPAKALSERVGTALVNGSWFIRRMQRLEGRAVVMHGHRHVDWIGECEVPIISAPSPVMSAGGGADTHFYIHALEIGGDGLLKLLEPQRVTLSESLRLSEADS